MVVNVTAKDNIDTALLILIDYINKNKISQDKLQPVLRELGRAKLKIILER